MTVQPAAPPDYRPPAPPPVLLAKRWRIAIPANRKQALQVLSWAGVALSCVTFMLTLPTLLQRGGAGPFTADLAGLLWTLALLVAASVFTRTLPWRALIGIFFAGFFAVTALATLVGRPIVVALGSSSALATAVWVPLTEETLKVAPVALLLWLVHRQSTRRPSLGDIAVIGALVGAGFTLYEDALYGRMTAWSWGGAAPFSWMAPSIQSVSVGSTTYVVGGHVVFTALLAVAIGVWALYRNRFRWAWVGVVVAVIAAVLGHMTANGVAGVSPLAATPAWTQVGVVLTLGGYLGPVLLLAGVVVGSFYETRASRREGRKAMSRLPWYRWLLLSEPEVARRSALFASLQR